MAKYFMSADILLPKNCEMERWAVIACDQFTSDHAYWDRVKENVKGTVSTLHMIIPEADLGKADDSTIDEINATMRRYLEEGVFCVYSNAYVYVERTLKNGAIRQGIVGMLDLQNYEYDPSKHPMISATENTVLERIPPRVAVRKDAQLEFPHVLLLCEDPEECLIEAVAARKDTLPKLYDFDLMEGGGHIAGWLLAGSDAQAFDAELRAYEERNVYLVGDGNHSLVTAKTCYENLLDKGEADEKHPARYALVELENIHSPAMVFEPIHRVITATDPEKLLRDLQSVCIEGGVCVPWIAGEKKGEIYLNVAKGELTVGVLQDFLDKWLTQNEGEIDYIHDTDAVMNFAKVPAAIGFLLPAMGKNELFPFVQTGRTLPRKTFSMGHGAEKRYYLEGRRIR